MYKRYESLDKHEKHKVETKVLMITTIMVILIIVNYKN